MIRKLEIDIKDRIETGTLQFNDDWPGVFIRGDNANWYAFLLESLLHGENLSFVDKITLNGLVDLLKSSRL